MDFLLGMDGKHAEVSLQTGTEKFPEVIFMQPAFHRLKNSWQMNVRSDPGFFGKMKQRNRMLNFLFNHTADG